MKNDTIEDRLQTALEEVKRLRAENTAFKRALALSGKSVHPVRDHEKSANSVSEPVSTVSQKIALFRSLFRGQEDVYAQRWESQGGISGYSPAQYHVSDTAQCRRPRETCKKLGKRLYFPITDEVVYRHLSGAMTIGVYPLRSDESCCFLAIDFDRDGWKKDVTEFLAVSARMAVPAYPERSRSGSGGNVWIFFRDSVPAVKARRLGAAFLAAASKRRSEIAPDSFDRMFPNQDRMPRGGFGNLIALPLQKKARAHDNSIFLDDSLAPAEDQWAYLAGVQCLAEDELDSILHRIGREDLIPSSVADIDKTAEFAPTERRSTVYSVSRTTLDHGFRRAGSLRLRLDNMLFFYQLMAVWNLKNSMMHVAGRARRFATTNTVA